MDLFARPPIAKKVEEYFLLRKPNHSSIDVSPGHHPCQHSAHALENLLIRLRELLAKVIQLVEKDDHGDGMPSNQYGRAHTCPRYLARRLKIWCNLGCII